MPEQNINFELLRALLNNSKVQPAPNTRVIAISDATRTLPQIRLDPEKLKNIKQLNRERYTRIYNNNRAQLLSQNILSHPGIIQKSPLEMTDEEIKTALAIYNSPNNTELLNIDPKVGLTDQGRWALGSYTNEEREIAANLNDLRSALPLTPYANFGRDFAYYNPAGEFDAFHGLTLLTAGLLSLPAAFAGGMGVPATVTRIGEGINTARSAGQALRPVIMRNLHNGLNYTRSILTSPRALVSTAMNVTPFALTASEINQEYSNLPPWLRPFLWIADNPGEAIMTAGAVALFGKPLWNKTKKLYNKSKNYMTSKTNVKEPAGNPGEFTDVHPTAPTDTKFVINTNEGILKMKPEPVVTDYKIVIPEPSSPRPALFNEPAPIKPANIRPKGGKRARTYDKLKAEYDAWESRKKQYEDDNAELNQQWSDYDNATQNGSKFDESKFEADKQLYATEKANVEKYNTDLEAYNNSKTKHEADTKAYIESEEYQKYLKDVEKRKKFLSNLKYYGIAGATVGVGGIITGLTGNKESNFNTDNLSEVDSIFIDAPKVDKEGFIQYTVPEQGLD